MKKSLLLSTLIGATALSMTAATPQLKPVDRNERRFAAEMPQPALQSRHNSRATDDEPYDFTQMTWGYTSQVYNATSLGSTYDKIMVAIEMPAEYSKLYAGSKITEILYPLGTAEDTEANIANEATAWIRSGGIDGAVATSESVTLKGQPGQFNIITLSTPYEIKENDDLFIGLSITNKEKSLPIVFSYAPPYTEYGCYVGASNGTQEQWMSAGNQIGYLPVMVTLEGDRLPQNVLRIYTLSVPAMVSMGQEFSATIGVQNAGAAPINSIGMQAYTAGSERPDAKTITIRGGGIEAYPDVLLLTATGMLATAAGDGEYIVETPQVNGVDNTLSNMTKVSAEQLVLPEGAGFKRNSVFEDATGTWCGFCPAAYADMEKMREEYKDYGFIGIGVHSSTQGAVDPMDVMSTSGACYAGLGNYISGFPTVLMNRESQFGAGKGADMIAALVDTYENSLSPLEVEATIDMPENSNRITVNTSTSVAVDFDNTRYKLSFVITEDNVGPYMQTNYYAGGKYGEAGGFENMPASVPLIFNDVARTNYNFSGVNNSLPATLKAGESYDFTTKLSLTTIKDKTKYAVNVLVIDQKTGIIANACRVYSPIYSGVENIAVDNDDNIKFHGGIGTVTVTGADTFEVYNLAGQRVSDHNLPAGTYIVRAAGKAAKVLVK